MCVFLFFQTCPSHCLSLSVLFNSVPVCTASVTRSQVASCRPYGPHYLMTLQFSFFHVLEPGPV